MTYSYDANGNMLEENDQGRITAYGYNSQNQMVQNTVGGLTTNYQYNADGIRHAQSDGIVTTHYLVDANRSYAQVLAESVNGSLDVACHYGDDLISQSRGGRVSYFHVDGLGSTRMLTDSSGSQTDCYAYVAFGEVLVQDGVTDNSYLYTGEQYDENLDQYYLRARYYDQGVGRFTQMDAWMGRPIEPITLNKYLYGHTDPANLTDPTGNFGLASFGAASNIRAAIQTTSVPTYSGFITKAVGATLQASGRAVTQKTALRTLRKCIRKKNKCGLQFNLLIVGYDNPKARDHIRDSQIANTVVLTYDRDKTGNRQWYRKEAECRVPRAGYQCDEYPFFKTEEGGPGKPWVSLRMIPSRENSVVGGHFGFLAKSMNKSKDKNFVVITSTSLPTVSLPIGKKK